MYTKKMVETHSQSSHLIVFVNVQLVLTHWVIPTVQLGSSTTSTSSGEGVFWQFPGQLSLLQGPVEIGTFVGNNMLLTRSKHSTGLKEGYLLGQNYTT